MRRMAAILVWLFVFTTGLFTPAQAAPETVVAILMPGAGGAVPIDFLIRNLNKFKRAGLRTVVATSPAKAVAVSKSESSQGRRVVIVGMSRGTIGIAKALSRGAQVSRAVFVSGNFKAVMGILKSPDKLPDTLVVHHRHDRCQHTAPTLVERFSRWARGKAQVVWINTSGRKAKNPCGPVDAHGFYKKDAQAVAAIIDFIR